MLEIVEKTGTAGYEDIIAFAGRSDLHITESLDGNTVTGFIAYAYSPERTVVYGFSDGGDLMLCDGLVRSVMFKSVLKGIDAMLFQLPEGNDLGSLEKLRFLKKGSTLCTDLNSYMNSCEHCKSAKDT